MPPKLTEDLRGILTCGKPARVVTLDPDGSRQVGIAWTCPGRARDRPRPRREWRKIRNTRHDPRVPLSIETSQSQLPGLDGHLPITGITKE